MYNASLYTTIEAAKLLGLTRQGLVNHEPKGRIRFTRMFGRVLVTGEELSRFAEIYKTGAYSIHPGRSKGTRKTAATNS
jgi:hypothetical protein